MEYRVHVVKPLNLLHEYVNTARDDFLTPPHSSGIVDRWSVGANFKLEKQIISSTLSYAVAGIGQWNYFEQCEAFHALFYNNNKNLYR